MKTFSIIFLSLLSLLSYSQDLMTIGEVFDFSVGDEFHYTVSPPDVPPAVDRITISGKYFSASADTVFYERYHHSYWTELEWVPAPHLVYHFYTNTDTVFYTSLDSLISYYDSGFQCDSSLYGCETNIYYSEEYCGALINGYYIATNDFEPDIYRKEYGQGLGWVYDYLYSNSSLPPGIIYEMKMFYFQKDGIDCGSPDTITVSVPEIIQNSGPVSIYPNPAKDHFSVKINGPEKEVTYKIYDLCGNLVDSGKWTNELNTYDCKLLPGGIYMIRAFFKSKSYICKLIVE
jgi:hypothetical protein